MFFDFNRPRKASLLSCAFGPWSTDCAFPRNSFSPSSAPVHRELKRRIGVFSKAQLICVMSKNRLRWSQRSALISIAFRSIYNELPFNSCARINITCHAKKKTRCNSSYFSSFCYTSDLVLLCSLENYSHVSFIRSWTLRCQRWLSPRLYYTSMPLRWTQFSPWNIYNESAIKRSVHWTLTSMSIFFLLPAVNSSVIYEPRRKSS